MLKINGLKVEVVWRLVEQILHFLNSVSEVFLEKSRGHHEVALFMVGLYGDAESGIGLGERYKIISIESGYLVRTVRSE